MTECSDYSKATNAAYSILQKYYGSYPRVDIYRIVSSFRNIIIKTYSQMAEMYKITHNEFTYNRVPSEYGFTIADYDNNNFLLCYNNKKDEQTIKFTFAHELGHIVLRHMVDDNTANKEANCFARNILCPVQIVEEFHLNTPNDYSECFGISVPMAEAAFAHHRSDIYYITKELYNAVNDNIYGYMAGYTPSELYGFHPDYDGMYC